MDSVRDAPLRSAKVAVKLGLPELATKKAPRCHQYQNGCQCPSCLAIAGQIAERGFDHNGKIKPPPRPKQPWDKAA